MGGSQNGTGIRRFIQKRAEKIQRFMNTAPELDRKDSNMMYAQLCLMEGYIEVLIKRV